jgi:alkanesulfonate monooxygenase SsuD/methylene tetrahydromethanopterin reductase-like flavin-dependent oxidoreductase (luciferase family)
VKFGLRIDDFGWPGGDSAMAEQLVDIARRAEAAGFDSIWMWDHFVQLRRWEDPLLEGWMALAHIAAVTRRVKLGMHVSGVTHRAPRDPGEAGHDPRCPLKREGLLRRRRSLERA